MSPRPRATPARRRSCRSPRSAPTPTRRPTTAAPRAKAKQAVREAFPAATIIRPSLVFGPEDDLTNRFAAMARLPFLPVIAAKRNFQPVYVRDLAKAIAMAALDPARFGGKTYEIGGPQVDEHGRAPPGNPRDHRPEPRDRPMPDFFASAARQARLAPRGAAHPRPVADAPARQCAVRPLPGLEAFGIEPTPLAAVAYEWLGRFHRGGKFAGRRINLTATS